MSHTMPKRYRIDAQVALVMANSASDARHSEADIRRTLIKQNLISGMLTLPSNMFYTVTLPATLWFFDKAKTDDRILFIDARNVFTQIDRAHREFSTAQINNLAMISRLHKGLREEFVQLVERCSSRRVEAFLSDDHIDPDYAVEFFVLESQPSAENTEDSGEKPTESAG